MEIYGRFLNWFLKTSFWKAIGKFCAIYNLRFLGYPVFPIDDHFKIIDLMDPEKYYAFLSTDTKTISAILIKTSVAFTGKDNTYGLFSHAGLILPSGNDRTTKVMHVNHAGFQYQSILAHLKEIDYLAVVELPVKEDSREVVERSIKTLKKQAKQIEYDWELNLDNDAYHIYCSEMLYMLFKNVIDNPNFKPRLISGKLYFDPDILLKTGKIVYTNHPKLTSLVNLTKPPVSGI